MIRSRLLTSAFGVALLATTGCGGSIALPKTPFIAVSEARSTGQIHVNDVVYVPAESGLLTPTQIFHSSHRFVVNMPQSIADWAKDALEAELRHSGFSAGLRAPVALGLRVSRLGIDQFPMSIETTLAGEFSISREGFPVVKMPLDLKRHHNLGTSLEKVTKDFNAMLSEGYGKFFAREDVMEVLAGESTVRSEPEFPRGMKLYSKEGAVFGEVVADDFGHLSPTGAKQPAVQVQLSGGTLIWISMDEVRRLKSPPK